MSYGECERFYDLHNSLAVATHPWLDASGDLFVNPDNPERFNETILRDTFNVVLGKPQAIDRFISKTDNEDGSVKKVGRN